jgi:hypothetical protein
MTSLSFFIRAKCDKSESADDLQTSRDLSETARIGRRTEIGIFRKILDIIRTEMNR